MFLSFVTNILLGTEIPELEKIFYVEENFIRRVFLSYKDAKAWVKKKQHNYEGKLNVWAECLPKNSKIAKLRQMIIDGKIVEKNEVKKDKN